MGQIQYVSKYTGKVRTRFVPDDASCPDCHSLLTEENWTIWHKKKGHKICRECSNKRIRTSKGYLAKRLTKTKKKIFPPVLSRKISNFQKDAALRGHKIEMTYEQFGKKMLSNCQYCGQSDAASGFCGIDRVDSSKDYTEDNTVACCRNCNIGKGTMSPKQYLEHCRKVVANMELK